MNTLRLGTTLLSIALFLAACNIHIQSETPTEDSVTPSPQEFHVEKPDGYESPLDSDENDFHFGFEWQDYTTIQATNEIQITIAYVTDELLTQFNDFIEFSHTGIRNPREMGIAFISNVPIQNFRYIKINGAEIQFIVEGDLFVLDELRPDMPLLVDWAAMGSGAYGGFAFDDEFGVTRYFGFNYCAAGFTAFRYVEFMADDIATI